MIKKHAYLIILLTSLVIISLSATDIYVSALPEMTIYFNTTPDIVNMTLGAFIAGLAIGTLFAGILSDRYGRRPVTLFSVGAFMMLTLGIACCDNIITAIALRALQGLASAGFIIVARQVIKDYFPAEKQISAAATMATGIILSPALAPVVGAYLSISFGWRSCFFASAIICFAIFIWAYFSMPETNKSKINSLPSISEFIKLNASLMVSKRYSGYIISNGCIYGAYYTFITISSYIYIQQYKLSQEAYSYIYILLAAAYLAGNSLTKLFVKMQIKAKKAILYACYISVAGGIINFIYFFAPHCTALVIVTFTLGSLFSRASIGIMSAPMQVLVMNDYSEKSAQALGLLFFFTFIFQFIATVVVSLFHSDPMVGLIVVTAIFCAIMLPTWITTMRARRKPHTFLPEFLKNLE